MPEDTNKHSAAPSAARGPLRREICDLKQNEYACLIVS